MQCNELELLPGLSQLSHSLNEACIYEIKGSLSLPVLGRKASVSDLGNQAAVDSEKMKRAQKDKEEKKIAAKKKREESKAKGYEDRSGRREGRKTKG